MSVCHAASDAYLRKFIVRSSCSSTVSDRMCGSIIDGGRATAATLIIAVLNCHAVYRNLTQLFGSCF